MEMLPGNSVEPAQMSLGLVPEVFEPVDVGAVLDEGLPMVDAFMLEAGDVEHVVGRETVCKDDGIRLYTLLDDGHERLAPGIGDDHGVDLASALEEAEDRNLSAGTAAAFTFAPAAEVALVEFDFTIEQIGCFLGQAFEDELAEFMEEQRRCVPVDPDDVCRCARG